MKASPLGFMQTHRYSFFGQKTAMIFQSGDWSEPWMFLTFIKKREGGAWEKLAEGKTVKLSLPEIVALKSVVSGEKPEWKTFHKSNGTGTPISARIESNKEDRGSPTVLINAGDYLRPVNYPETVILEKLLAHVFEEKIAHATGTNKSAAEEVPREAPEDGAAEEAADPAPVPPEVNAKVLPPQIPDEDMTLAESLARYKIPPLPQRLPSGVFPMTGRLKSIRTENGTTTLFLKLASGTVEEIPAADIVGAGIHGAEVDLVIKAIPSPQKPAAVPAKAKPAPKRGKADDKPENTPEAPEAGEATTVYATSIKQVTQKALLVTKAGGTELWIPKSALAVPAPTAPQDTAWQFAVKDWFAQKPDFQAWVKST